MRALLLAALALALGLAGCASTPKGGGERASAPRTFPADRDGPGANPPADLASIPDAEPRIEAIRPGGANKPYQALGKDYVPITRDQPFSERGLASWYGRKFHGRRTSSGEPYDMYAMTAAHPTLPLPSYARIRNPANGREVIVRINDRGPFHAGRIVDLSYAAALRLDLLRGVAPVELERLTFDEIRAGNWRKGGPEAPRLAQARPRAEPVAPVVPGAAVVSVATLPAPAEPIVVPPAVAPPADPPEIASMSPSPAAAPTAAPPAVVALVAPSSAAAAPAASQARGYWVQLGAFRESAGAESFQRRVGAEVDWLAPLLATFGDAAFFRVQAGPYASRDDAQVAAVRVREALGLVPLVVERQ